jgi:hypothetical protein
MQVIAEICLDNQAVAASAALAEDNRCT